VSSLKTIFDAEIHSVYHSALLIWECG